MTILSSIPLFQRPQYVRQHFKTQKIDGFIITRGDEYLGEYVACYAERLAWLTGFTGSAGLAVLLQDKGCVFSDGRYTAQLEEQVPHALWERRHIGTDPLQEWLASNAPGLKIGYDSRLVSQSQITSWQAKGVTLVPVAHNPIDAAWHDQPVPPAEKIIAQPLKYAGESSLSKRKRLAEQLREAGQKAMILADCTSIMWLLNLRGHDVPMTPLAHGYAVLHDDSKLDYFVLPERMADPLEESVHIQLPETLEICLMGFTGQNIRLDPATTPVWFADVLEKAGAKVVSDNDLCSLPKALKNKAEQEGSRQAHHLDAIALVRFLHWLENHAVGKTETELAAKLEEYRSVSPDYCGPSFETISASGPNGAYPHYCAEVGKERTVTKNSVYLVDSGAQYPFGTTDITRTVWIGPEAPSTALREAYTRVLKGHIALSNMRFPEGTAGYRLDAIARASLWEAGLDYDHGTGHGIGSYLSVHEGPQSISSVPRPVDLEAGMILSNEPGYYAIGHYGIRIENLLLVKKADLAGYQDRTFLEFEMLSYTPIDQRLVELSLLDCKERLWLDSYHAEIEKRLLPHLEETLHPWLKAVCAPLQGIA